MASRIQFTCFSAFVKRLDDLLKGDLRKVGSSGTLVIRKAEFYGKALFHAGIIIAIVTLPSCDLTFDLRDNLGDYAP